jgi:hypothetical protein
MSTPIKFVDKADIATILDGQKDNLLNGIQDSSCEYCWRVERQGHPSRRHTYLKDFNFDPDQFVHESTFILRII